MCICEYSNHFIAVQQRRLNIMCIYICLMSFLLLLEAQLGDDMTIDVILPNGLPVLCDVTLPSEQIVSEVCFACSCIDILLSVMYNI